MRGKAFSCDLTQKVAQAIEYWEKSAQEAMEGGLDPAGALKWFGRAEELADTLSQYFRRDRPMSVWMIPRPDDLGDGSTPSSPAASAPMYLGPLPPTPGADDATAPPLAGAVHVAPALPCLAEKSKLQAALQFVACHLGRSRTMHQPRPRLKQSFCIRFAAARICGSF